MKIQWKKLILCLAIPLGVGGLSALLTRGGMKEFATLNQPPLTPPPWVFGVAWTVLYLLMGIASYLVLTSGHPYRARTALTVYGVQLAFNFLWSIWFFNLSAFWFAFGWLIVLWGLILLTTVLFARLSFPAGVLMVPYLLWVTFAAYLNFGVAWLN